MSWIEVGLILRAERATGGLRSEDGEARVADSICRKAQRWRLL